MFTDTRGKVVNLQAIRAQEISPDDNNDLPFEGGIYVGGDATTAGNVRVTLAEDDSDVTFRNVPDGTILPIRAKRVFATGTTALNLVLIA